MKTAFDQALELTELHWARETYASRHGEPGSVAYSAAWLRFHQQIKTIEDLQRLRANAARKRRQLKAVTARPADTPPAPKRSRPRKLVHA